MVALTKEGQDCNPSYCPKQPHGERPWKGTCRHGYSWLPQLWSWKTTPDYSTLTGHGTGATISRNQGQISQGTNARHEGTNTGGTPTPSSVLDTRAGAIWHCSFSECSNEAPVIMDGQRVTTLIDSGAQV